MFAGLSFVDGAAEDEIWLCGWWEKAVQCDVVGYAEGSVAEGTEYACWRGLTDCHWGSGAGVELVK